MKRGNKIKSTVNDLDRDVISRWVDLHMIYKGRRRI